MSQNQTKPWERPWTTKEMIENASNWNLAGDAGLLQYLEDFSDKMLSKVKDTNDRLNELIDSAAETSLALSNVTNKFMGLRNTQFIESRVYEDDETLPAEADQNKEPQQSKQTEAERLEEMKQAIVNGLDIIDEYYEKVEIPESDSEDDTNGASVMYRPIDPYIDRPLPYVIGTAEWHKYWHVGLAHSSSESEIDNEQYSESDSEEYLPMRDRSQIPGISDSESEDLPKQKVSQGLGSTTEIDKTQRNLFDSSSESEAGSLPPQVNTVNSNFAEELAAKLGKVETVANTEVNTKPIKRAPKINSGLFSDEPPPLEDDGMFSNKNAKSDLFSGGLFDDLDGDTDFWNNKPVIPKKSVPVTASKSKDNLFSGESEDENDIFSAGKKREESNVPIKETVNQVKKSGGLFDEDDDDLFKAASLTQPKKNILPPYKTSVPLISDEPPALEPTVPRTTHQESQPKKPVGGVLVLGANMKMNKDLEEKRKNVSEIKPEAEKNIFPRTQEIVQSKKRETVETSNKKDINVLFDDTSPLFSDDIFSSLSTKKFTSNLFSDDNSESNENLFKVNDKQEVSKVGPKQVVEEKKEETKSKEVRRNKEEIRNKQEITNKDMRIKEETKNKEEIRNKEITHDIFSSKPPPLNPTSKTEALFGDDIEDSLFSPKPKVAQKPQNLDPAPAKKFGLFDDDDLEDSLFSSRKGKSHSLFDPNPPDLVPTKKEKPLFQPVNLFDPNPPELDESDAKSESHSQLSLESESSNFGAMSSTRATLFDSEPPLLPDEENFKDNRFKGEVFNDIVETNEDLFSSNSTRNTLQSIMANTNKKDQNIPPISSSELSKDEHVQWDDKLTKNNVIKSESKVTLPSVQNKDVEDIFGEDKFVSKQDMKQNLSKKESQYNPITDIFHNTENVERKDSSSKVEKENEEENLFKKLDSPTRFPELKMGSITESHINNKEIDSLVSGDEISQKNENDLFVTRNIEERKDSFSILSDRRRDETEQLPSSYSSHENDKKTQSPALKQTLQDSNLFWKNGSSDSLFDDDIDIFTKTKQTKGKQTGNVIGKSLGADNFEADEVRGVTKVEIKYRTSTDSGKQDYVLTSDINFFQDFDEPILSDDISAPEQLLSTKTRKITPPNYIEPVCKNPADSTRNEPEKNDNKKNSVNEIMERESLKQSSVDKKGDLDLAKEVNDEQTVNISSATGKIKHNLNINVAALLPGSVPPRRQNLEKSTSLDFSESNHMKLSADENTSPVKSNDSKPNLEKSISFDYPVQTGEILTSAAKERVRIPVKRRPSTRKARQEAIRKSHADFSSDNSISESLEVKAETILNIANNNFTNDKLKNLLANPLSPSTDEDDLFSVPKVQEMSDNFKDNSFFGKAPTISPTEELPTEMKKESKDANTNNTKSATAAAPIKNILKLDSDDDSDTEFNFTKSIQKRTRPSKFIFSSSDSDDLSSTFSKSKGRQNDNNNIDLSPDDDLFKPAHSSKIVTSAASTTTKSHSKSLFDGDLSDGESNILSKSSVPNVMKPRVFPANRKSIKEEVTKLPVEKDPLDALKQ